MVMVRWGESEALGLEAWIRVSIPYMLNVECGYCSGEN